MKVLAGIVTHNRLTLLKECLTSLHAQTYTQFDILVVNNDSTDGTSEFLDATPSLIVIHQENLGGAGGFHACMKYAVENGYDYVWLMDDDGIAAPDQLELLLDGIEKYHLDWANALPIYKEDHSRTVDGLDVDSFIKEQCKDGLFAVPYPFNGSLISCSVIKAIGYVKKEMFIWGDEREWYHRFCINGYNAGTIIAAKHYHPLFKLKKDYIIPFIKLGPQLEIKPYPLNKYRYRNMGYIDKVYGGTRKKVKKYVLYYLLRFDLKQAISFVRCYNLGWNEDYETKI